MHHHPAPVNTPLIDNYILKNANDFWDAVKNKKIELIICGHVHGDYSFKFNDIMIETSLATCLQWKKGTQTLEIDDTMGYKVYYFDKNGYKAFSRSGV